MLRAGLDTGSYGLPRFTAPYQRWQRAPSVTARVSIHAAAAIALVALSACGNNPPPIVSADTSCERFAHISANDAQIQVFKDNWSVMESYADQVIVHNEMYDRHCLGAREDVSN